MKKFLCQWCDEYPASQVVSHSFLTIRETAYFRQYTCDEHKHLSEKDAVNWRKNRERTESERISREGLYGT